MGPDTFHWTDVVCEWYFYWPFLHFSVSFCRTKSKRLLIQFLPGFCSSSASVNKKKTGWRNYLWVSLSASFLEHHIIHLLLTVWTMKIITLSNKFLRVYTELSNTRAFVMHEPESILQRHQLRPVVPYCQEWSDAKNQGNHKKEIWL